MPTIEPNSPLTLRSSYERRPAGEIEAEPGWYGTFELVLEIHEPAAFPPGSQLALWCAMLLEPTVATNARVVDRISGHLVLEPVSEPPTAKAPSPSGSATTTWTISDMRSTFPARHANDGPERAYVILPSGITIHVSVIPTTRAPTSGPAAEPANEIPPSSANRSANPGTPPLVPFPIHVEFTGSGLRRRLEQRNESAHARDEWSAIRDLAARLGHDAFDRDDAEALQVDIVFDDEMPASAYRLQVDRAEARLVARDSAGVRHGLTTLAQWSSDGPLTATVEDQPAMPVRAVHLDVARRWYEPDVVARLIDLAAWRKFNRVHLHLTDDEAWRVPVAAFPELSMTGGTRGHGLPIGPLCGSGPAPYGRAYTEAEIAAWVQRADLLGVVLVPEVDVPGHSHAALVALPGLRDPDDTSRAASVQGFPRNVLIPGHPTTMPFLEATFGSLADLFPNSPWLHIGGDEVPKGAWDGSPIVAGYAAAHGLTTQREIESSFHRDLIAMIRSATGRDVAMWEEAALAGLEPSGYAIAWTSIDAGHRLADAGHDVVVAPGQAYYLDMAPSRDWQVPGSSWAGNAPFETTCAFDPFEGWPPAATGRLLGVQACIWGEHVADITTLDALAFPRLDAIAERGWTGEIIGDPDNLRRRAANLPRFSATI